MDLIEQAAHCNKFGTYLAAAGNSVKAIDHYKVALQRLDELAISLSSPEQLTNSDLYANHSMAASFKLRTLVDDRFYIFNQTINFLPPGRGMCVSEETKRYITTNEVSLYASLSLYNMALVYHDLGELDVAFELYEKSFELIDLFALESDDDILKSLMIAILNNQAHIHFAANAFDELNDKMELMELMRHCVDLDSLDDTNDNGCMVVDRESLQQFIINSFVTKISTAAAACA